MYFRTANLADQRAGSTPASLNVETSMRSRLSTALELREAWLRYTATCIGAIGPSPCASPSTSTCAGALHWVRAATARPLSTAATWPARLQLLQDHLAGAPLLRERVDRAAPAESQLSWISSAPWPHAHDRGAIDRRESAAGRADVVAGRDPDAPPRAGAVAGALFGLENLLVAEALRLTLASHVIVFLYAAPLFAALGLHACGAGGPQKRMTSRIARPVASRSRPRLMSSSRSTSPIRRFTGRRPLRYIAM